MYGKGHFFFFINAISVFNFNNLLTPKSDKHLISPNNITPELHIKVTRIKEMITHLKSS